MLGSAHHPNAHHQRSLSAQQSVDRRIAFQQGIPTETSKRLVAEIKKQKLKVQAAIQGDSLRVSGKNKDDLQAVIALLRSLDLDVPLTYSNYR